MTTERKEGSGFASETARIIAEMTALLLMNQDESAKLRGLVAQLQVEIDRGRCGISTTQAEKWLRAIVAHLALDDVTNAEALPTGYPGDIKVELESSPDKPIWIELKAATQKMRFGDLVQADWVRDRTDYLSWLLVHEPSLRALLSPHSEELLFVDAPDEYFAGWDEASLWVADVALLSTRTQRLAAGVAAPGDLLPFIARKYLLHVAREGARITCLTNWPTVVGALENGQAPKRLFVANRSSEATIWVNGTEEPRRGRLHMQYYIYPGYGRHKVNDHLVREASDLFAAGD